MHTLSTDQIRPKPVKPVNYALVGLCLTFLPLVLSNRALGADMREDLHQKILAGEQVSMNPSDSEDARTIDPKWLKEAALRHVRVDIHRAVIVGVLDAEDVTFEKDFRMEGCIFTGFPNFSHAVFKHGIEATETIFRSGASFQGAIVERAARFQSTKFEGGVVDFDDAHFLGIFDATLAKFVCKDRSMAVFNNVRFDSTAIFSISTFDVGADFVGTQFSGEAYFAGAKFSSDVDFERSHFVGLAEFGEDPSNKRFSATFASTAVFMDAQFDSTALFDGATFGGDAHFFSAKFAALARFRGATFGSFANFSMVRFGNDGWFMGTAFLHKANFGAAYVAGSLYFYAEKPLPAAVFRGEAQFARIQVENFVAFGGGDELVPGAVFTANAMFSGARFGGVANFQGVEFKRDAGFLDISIGNDFYLPGAIFDGGAVFDRAQIKGAALFSPKPGPANSKSVQSAHFLGGASFVGAHFGSGVRFNGVKFDEGADFAGAQFEGDAHFEHSEFLGPSSFRSATFRAVYLSPADTGGTQQFESDVDLLGCTYERIQVDWRSLLRYPNGRSRVHPYDRQPYIELEAALRRAGSAEDADEVYSERRRVENRNLTGSRKVLDRIYFLLANYGIDGWHEFFITLLFLGLGTWVFSRPSAVVQNWDLGEAQISPSQALRLAFHQFLPFGLPVKPSWTPSRHIVFRFLRASTYANFLQVLGWILIPLAAAWIAGFLRHGIQ